MSEAELLETKGRISQHLKLYLTVLVIVAICEMIGIIKIPAGPGTVILLPMLFAVIIGLLITSQVLGKSIQGLKKIVSNDVVELAGPRLSCFPCCLWESSTEPWSDRRWKRSSKRDRPSSCRNWGINRLFQFCTA